MTLRNNIYNKLPTSIFSSNYLPIQPNTESISILKNFKDQLQKGLDQGLSYGGINEDKKQIKTIDNYNKIMEPIALENKVFEQKEQYDNTLIGKIDNLLSDSFKNINDSLGFNIDTKSILFALIILIIIFKI